MKKSTYFLFAAITLSIFLVGCWSPPPGDSIVEKRIVEALRTEVHPMAIGHLLGGSNAKVDEFEILDKSYHKEKPNALTAAFGAQTQRYWLVEVRVKGTATVGKAGQHRMLSGGSETRKDFHSRMRYKFFKKEDGTWAARLVL